MDAVLEIDIVSAMQDTKALQQHAGHVLTASTTLAKLEELLEASPGEDEDDRHLRLDCIELDFIKPYLSLLTDTATTLQEQIESLLLCGLRHLSPVLLGQAVQAADYRRRLKEIVELFLNDLSDVVQERTRSALDLHVIGKKLGEIQPPLYSLDTLFSVYYSSNGASSSKEQNQLQRWISTAYAQIRALVVDEMAPIFTKVHFLEHVLRSKYSSESGSTLLDVVSNVSCIYSRQTLDSTPADCLWTSFARNFGSTINQCVHESDFWRFIFLGSYPRLLEIFRDLFVRITILTDPFSTRVNEEPEAAVALLSRLESSYLGTVAQNLTEARQSIRAAFTNTGKLQTAPTAAQKLALLAHTEIKAAASNAQLTERVSQLVTNTINTFLNQVPGLAHQDDNGFTLQKAQPSPQHYLNISLINTLITLRKDLAVSSAPDSAHSWKAFSGWQESISQTLNFQLITPMNTSVRREVLNVLGRVHRFKFDKPLTPVSSDIDGSECSTYMLELKARLSFLYTGIFSHLSMTPELEKFLSDLANYASNVFLWHVSLVRLHDEADKMQIVNDITLLESLLRQMVSYCRRSSYTESSLNQFEEIWCTMGNYKSVLFIPFEQLRDVNAVTKKFNLPRLLWAQHLMTRSMTLPLLNELQNLSKTAYVESLLSTSQGFCNLASQDATRTALNTLKNWLFTQASNNAAVKDPADTDVLTCLRLWMSYLESP